jgi:hypothetical protein
MAQNGACNQDLLWAESIATLRAAIHKDEMSVIRVQ